jgi:hypothetical protein
MLPAWTCTGSTTGSGRTWTETAYSFGVDDPPTPPKGVPTALTAAMGPKPGKYPCPTGGDFGKLPLDGGSYACSTMRWVLLLLVTLSGVAGASCVWRFDCTNGPCRQVAVCEGPNDWVTAGPPPPRVPPIPTPTVRPVPVPMTPPVGATSCAPRYFCGIGGCRWQTVCR